MPRPLVTAGRAALLLSILPALLVAQAVNTDAAGLGVGGYDLVAYTRDSAVRGLPTITATHDGTTYRFATITNRDTFAASPAKYLPAYGGYCAYGVASGYKVKVDPEAFRIVEGKLYLNYDKGVQKRWLADVPGYIEKANAKWSELRDKPRN